MELWDILDEQGNCTGRTHVRGVEMLSGDYHLVVHIWIRNSAGQWLIQKRADTVGIWPGLWAATGGSAIAGEDSAASALREVREELGFTPYAAGLQFLWREQRKDCFSDIWLLTQDVLPEEFALQTEEVSDARWVTQEELQDMVNRVEFINYSYLDKIFTV